MAPTSGAHSTIERPECVRRVMPPTMTIANTREQQISSQTATCLPEGSFELIGPRELKNAQTSRTQILTASLRVQQAMFIFPKAKELWKPAIAAWHGQRARASIQRFPAVTLSSWRGSTFFDQHGGSLFGRASRYTFPAPNHRIQATS